VEQELPTLPEHLSSPPVFSGVHVTRSLVLYLCFVDRCLSFCTLSFGHCVFFSSSIYGFWLPLWYLQTLLTTVSKIGIYYSRHRFNVYYLPKAYCTITFLNGQFAKLKWFRWLVTGLPLIQSFMYTSEDANPTSHKQLVLFWVWEQ
jgi:hypothetical protein